MFKRILLTSLISIVLVALCGGYFYHVGKLERERRQKFVCKKIDIAVEDSLINKIITSEKIGEIVGNSYLQEELDSIPLHLIEMTVNNLGEVLSSEVYTTAESLVIRVKPRSAALRFITKGNQHFYCDETGYVFPVESKVNKPVVTGNIPVHMGKNFKGYSNDPRENQWIASLLQLVSYIEEHHYWKEMTSHLNINDKGEIELYPTSGNVYFIIGKAEDIPDKFKRMELWYKAIAPLEKAANYTVVNLEYDNQIICR